MTYSFLAKDNIPARLGAIKVRVWKENIHNILQRTPKVLKDNNMLLQRILEELKDSNNK
jgi:hypothetical protein